MAFFDKLQNVAKNVASDAGDALEVTKLKSKIGDENKKIAAAKAQLGELVWQQYLSGAEMPPDLDDLCVQIKLSQEQIAGLEAQIAEIKADPPAAAAPAPAAAAAPAAAPAAAACVSCGAGLAAGAKFCPNCGAAQPAERFCSGCGAKVSAEVRFCPNCGAAL